MAHTLATAPLHLVGQADSNSGRDLPTCWARLESRVQDPLMCWVVIILARSVLLLPAGSGGGAWGELQYDMAPPSSSLSLLDRGAPGADEGNKANIIYKIYKKE